MSHILSSPLNKCFHILSSALKKCLPFWALFLTVNHFLRSALSIFNFLNSICNNLSLSQLWFDVLSLGTFSPLGRFVLRDVLSLGTLCTWDVMSLGRFVPWDVLSLGRLVLGRFIRIILLSQLCTYLHVLNSVMY